MATNSAFHRLRVWWAGRSDGKVGIPRPEDDSPSEYEKQLSNRASQHLAQQWGAYQKKIQEIEGERQKKINELKTETNRYIAELKKYQDKKKKLGRDVTIYLSPTWYWVFISLIFIGEFALNSQAFMVFRKGLLLTYLMALAIAVGIPAVAHFVGIWVRQLPKPRWLTVLKIIVTIGGAVGCLYGVNIARREYLALRGVTLTGDQLMLERAFLLINIFVLLAATVMSYFSHEEDQELYNLHKRVTNGARTLDVIEERIHWCGARLDRLKAEMQAELEHTKAIVRELVHIYRRSNVRRRNGEKPKVFDRDVEIKEPTQLTEVQAPTAEAEVDGVREKRRQAEQEWAQGADELDAGAPR